MVLSNKLAKEVDGTENATVQLFCTFAAVTVFVGLKQGLLIDVAAADWLPVLLLGLINTGVGCYCYFSAIGDIPAQSVAICGYLEPLSAVLLSALILHETLTPLQIVGAVLIIGGAVFGECCTGRAHG